MGSSIGKRKEMKSSKVENFCLKTYPMWLKSKQFYRKRKFSGSFSKDDAVFYTTEREKKKKDASPSLKMTINPNVGQIPTNESKNCKYNGSHLIQVLDLILMMIGCIILKIDHKPRVRKRFKDVFNDKSLEILRSDLENLLRFESKSSLTRLIVDLINSQAAGELVWSEDLKDTTDPRKLILRRTLISVVNYMIFRRSKQKIESKSKVRRSVLTFEAENKLENSLSVSGTKTKSKFTFLGVWIANFRNIKQFFGICRCLFPTIGFICKDSADFEKEENLKDLNFDMDLSQGQLNLYGEDFYDCALNSGTHSCNKIYCPVCYGWLWIPVYYCIYIFIYPFVISVISCFTNGIRFLP